MRACGGCGLDNGGLCGAVGDELLLVVSDVGVVEANRARTPSPSSSVRGSSPSDLRLATSSSSPTCLVLLLCHGPFPKQYCLRWRGSFVGPAPRIPVAEVLDRACRHGQHLGHADDLLPAA